jgi:hypothetical protein
MEFFKNLKLELEDLQEELRSVSLNIPDSRVGDFGCGAAYTTLSLMLLLMANECVGIDKFAGDSFSPSCQEVRQGFDAVKDTILNAPGNLQENALKRDIWKLFSGARCPTFQQGDVLIGHNLPSNLDFAYCKRLLGNIYSGEYDNSPKGEEGVSRAINNMVGTLRQGGILCVVEKANIYFAPSIERTGLTFLRICRIHRGEIGVQGRLTGTTGIGQYFVYLYQKL